MSILSVTSSVGLAIDIIIIALIVIFGIIGYVKGFFKSVISMVSTIVVLVLSVLLANQFATLINKIYDFTGLIAGKISKGVASMGVFYSQAIPADVSGAEIAEQIPPTTNSFLKTLMTKVLKPLSASQIEGATVADIVSGAFASIIMTIIAGILIFVLIKIVIALVSRLFDNIARTQVLGYVNKIAGLAFGAIKGLVIVVVFAGVLTFLTVVPLVNTKISPIIQDNTKVGKVVYNYTDEFVEKHVIDGNLLQKWISNLWDNKYDDKPQVAEPNGNLDNPYNMPLREVEWGLTATIEVELGESFGIKYYKFKADLTETNFTFAIDMTDAGCILYSADDTETEITDYTNLETSKQYIIGIRGNADGVLNIQANITITPNTATE